MLVRTPGIIEMRSIVWQPRYDCTASCPGCYVKKSPAASYTGPTNTEILDLIFEDGTVRCKQLTISLDTVIETDKILCEALTWLWEVYDNHTDLPELCVTVHDLNAVQRWGRDAGLPLHVFLKPLTMFSLSSFPAQGKKCKELADLCKDTGTTLNYNRMATGQEPDSKAFGMGCRYADMVYLILRKPQLGAVLDRKDLENWFAAKKLVPADKLVEDSCLQDSVRFLKEGYTCSAGIGKVHIWPDDMTTGCPYDSLYYYTSYDGQIDPEVAIEDRLAETQAMGSPMDPPCKIPRALREYWG
jgi:hypothetical protein